MTDRISRRAALKAVLASSITAFGGCLEDLDESEGWPSFGFDVGNSGYAPEAVGPADEPSVRWEASVGDHRAGPPVVFEGRIYVGSRRGTVASHDQDGRLTALDESGDREWAYDVSAPVDGPITATRDGAYVGSNDGVVYALGPDGSLRWEFDVGSGTSVTATDEYVYATGADDGLVALSADGEEWWHYDPTPDSTVRGTPAYGGDRVFVGGSAVVAVEDGAADWTHGREEYRSGALVFADETLYAGETYVDGTEAEALQDRTVEAIDPSGERRWAVSLPGAGGRAASEDVLVVTTSDAVVGLDLGSGETIWEYECHWPRIPSVAGQVAYVETREGELHAVDVTSGDGLWKLDLGDDVTGRPAIANGTVYVGVERGDLLALN